MKKTHKTILLTIALALVLTLGWAQRTDEIVVDNIEAQPVTIVTTEEPEETTIEVIQSDAREEWLAKLIICESGGRPEAINPKDRDNTPSYGLLQFKPSTFELFSKEYGIEGELMDPEAQKAIVRRMMDDKSVVWEKQFPDCVRKLGTPPQR